MSHDQICGEFPPPNNAADGTIKQQTSPIGKHRRKERIINVKVGFLDESITVFQIEQKALGRTLFYQVCDSLSLVEVDYFGLSYTDSNGIQYWLDFEKPICKQLSLSTDSSLDMNFAVKFYTIDPSNLEEELTRYLFALQIKKDLVDGNLQCSENVAALLAAYIIQAECGDYNGEEYSDHFYISKFKLLPHQDEEFEIKVMENHKKLIGLSPCNADLQLLELAKQLDMYGIKLSPVKDHEGIPLSLAVIHDGILIFQNQTKVNTFDWAKIRKLSFKRKHFFIKLHQEEFFGDVLEFIFQHRNDCKNFWKKCIEQHSFFKCYEIKVKSRQKLRIFSRGSSFRYTGRTQQQISEYIKTNNNTRMQKPFQRSNSMKLTSYRDDDCLGYSSDLNDSPSKDNPDSISCATTCNTMRQMYKSCDTIDQESGLNYYSLHSIISLATDENSAHINGQVYRLHANQRQKWTRQIPRYCKYNTSKRRTNLNEIYLSIRLKALEQKKYRNKVKRAYILVSELPSICNYSFDDDSVDDCFLNYLQHYFAIRCFIATLVNKVIPIVIKPYRSSISNLILRSNVEQYFNYDFKVFNFDLRYKNFCANRRVNARNYVTDLKEDILYANLMSFKLL